MNLKSYLASLAMSPEKLAVFVGDPRQSAADAGLSEEDRAVLFSGNQAAIYARLTAETEKSPA